MSEQAPEPTPQSYSVSFVRVPSGRSHTITGQGVVPIADEEGNLEHVYRLVVEIDGEQYVLSEYPAGVVDGRVAALKSLREQQQQASTE